MRESLLPRQIQLGLRVQLRTQYDNLPATTILTVRRYWHSCGVFWVRGSCGLTPNANAIMKTVPITALEFTDEEHQVKPRSPGRNRKIVIAKNEGQSLTEIALKHGLTKAYVQQIIRGEEINSKAAAQLPGSENLTACPRKILISLGYRSVEQVRQAIQAGKLHATCANQMGVKRFAEIVTWAFGRASEKAETDCQDTNL